jgi:predicted esterase YcpF (UPF0227 family)
MKIFNIHGFGSSGENRTYKFLKKKLQDDEILSFDVPVNPSEALFIINYIVDNYGVDLITANSLGGLYALCLNNKNVKRILINPCIDPINVFGKTIPLGKHKFSNPRQNPKEKEFSIDQYFVDSLNRFASNLMNNLNPILVNNTFALISTNDEVCKTTKTLFLDKFNESNVSLIDCNDHDLTDDQLEKYLIPLI